MCNCRFLCSISSMRIFLSYKWQFIFSEFDNCTCSNVNIIIQNFIYCFCVINLFVLFICRASILNVVSHFIGIYRAIQIIEKCNALIYINSKKQTILHHQQRETRAFLCALNYRDKSHKVRNAFL